MFALLLEDDVISFLSVSRVQSLHVTDGILQKIALKYSTPTGSVVVFARKNKVC